MKYLLTAAQSGIADRYAMEEIHIPSLVLMERASLAVAEKVLSEYTENSRILIAAGTGNNGGDGVAIARMLFEKGFSPEILLAGDPAKYSPQMKQQLDIISYYKPVFIEHIEKEYDLIVDAVFGFGLFREVRGVFAEIIREINESHAKVISVDIPSGIHTDTGEVMGTAVRADETVTFTAGKPGLFLDPGRSYAGKVCIKEIGIPVKAEHLRDNMICILEEDDLFGLNNRDEAGNKSTFSKILVIAGSESMFGAAYLSACAALKTGAGMVKVFTHRINRTPLASLMPEALMDLYTEEDFDQKKLIEDIQWADVCLIGPGLGQNTISERITETFIRANDKPFVMDADALNIMSVHPEWWQLINKKCIITPHIGEMSRLTGISFRELKRDPVKAARTFALKHHVSCVMKDARTVTAEPDGTVWINIRGNSTLATAGSGDVLSGIIAGILGQNIKCNLHISSEGAAGAFIHGVCGEKAGERFGRAAAMAGNLLAFI